MTRRYVFGPVPSGRLGRSLGLDLTGSTICSFDCLYCEAGPTTLLTMDRRSWVPAAALLDELRAWKLDHGDELDHVTLGGSGEPCLHADLDEIVIGVRSIFPHVRLAVLTNSSLLSDPAVRSGLMPADVVLPSLDTLVPDEFARINRAHPSVDLAAMARGILDFRAAYDGCLRLETLLLADINDTEENCALLEDFCRRLVPDAVDVVTMSRPGAHAGAFPAARGRLERFRAALCRQSGSGKGVATPASFRQNVSGASPAQDLATLARRLCQSLRRRPQTAGQLAAGLAVSPEQVERTLELLVARGEVEPDPHDKAFFRRTVQAGSRLVRP